MASDLSNIIKNEVVNTLESLLSVSGSMDNVTSISGTDLDDQQCIKVESNFEFPGTTSKWNFYVPTFTATKFEYLMLGGIADLKDSIDDEISDAVKEIVSTICGSITTSVNAQGFDDIKGISFNLGQNSIIQCNEEKDVSNIYKFAIVLNDETLFLYIAFDGISVPFIEFLTNSAHVADISTDSNQVEVAEAVPQSASILSSLLGEESIDNLRLLFDIKLRLSVRLGTKICLLRDVINWDIGEIIELSQMTNEPLEILVNGVVVGEGEAVIVDGKFGVKIKTIGEKKLT